MNLLHLQYFKILAEKEHLLASAKTIHISPPALSSSISKLEQELGVQLFDHVGRNIKLNGNGQILYRHVCRIFAEVDAINQAFSKEMRQKPDTINVAVIAPTTWAEVTEMFINAHPGIIVNQNALQVEYLQNPAILEQYDLIITDMNEFPLKSWEHEFIVEDPPMILVSKNHSLANREMVLMRDLKNEPFVALSKTFAPRRFFDAACSQAGIIPNIMAETDYQLRTSLVESGAGIAFSSTLAAKAVRSTSIKAIRVGYPPNPKMQTVFWRPGKALLPAAQAFRDYLVAYYHHSNAT
ncbi:LysR family transcriptional regulator [Oscillibacter sp. GMB15532]|uniref:LysR family transcriptional regulator n=1 Tax=Oscillibacter sp. GMB15532 TaxID=3230022 RepID=UPI0034E02D97